MYPSIDCSSPVPGTSANVPGFTISGRTFVHYPAVQFDGDRVSNNLAEKGRGIFAFSLAQISILHVEYALMGITRFAVGRDRSFREVGQGFVLDQGLFESRFMSKTLKRDVFNSMQICRPYLCDVGAEYGSWAWSWFTFEGSSLARILNLCTKFTSRRPNSFFVTCDHFPV
jgi:hypothetical protein